MHAIVIRSTLHDFEAGTKSLKEEVIPRLKAVPGFVGAQWVRLDENTGTAMLTFESVEAMQAVMEMMKTNPPVGVTINTIETGEVAARV